jgi:hypothetical protein
MTAIRNVRLIISFRASLRSAAAPPSSPAPAPATAPAHAGGSAVGPEPELTHSKKLDHFRFCPKKWEGTRAFCTTSVPVPNLMNT